MIIIADYDPTWSQEFDALRGRLAAALGPPALSIEHVGRTAVPGLAAEPIIDLDVVIASRADLPATIAALAKLGYVHEGDLAPEYTPDMLCAGDCMLVIPPEIRQVQDESQAITSFGNPRTRPKKQIPPLFDLIRDLFKGE